MSEPRSRTQKISLALVALALGAFSAPALAQSGASQSGLRGRVVIAPEYAQAKTWPVDESEQRRIASGARIRRPTGQAAPRQLSQPMPELHVVLEGARPPQKPEPRQMRIEGMRFIPSQILVARPGELAIENTQRGPVTVMREAGEVLGTLEPGQTGTFALDEGEHSLFLRELPSARAKVKVLRPSRFLPVTKAGEIEPIAINSGEYDLSFYHGTRALRVQSLTLPEEKYLAIDAAVSANGVVTVSIKDGDLQVAVPPRPIDPPRPPPRTAPPPPPPSPSQEADGEDE